MVHESSPVKSAQVGSPATPPTKVASGAKSGVTPPKTSPTARSTPRRSNGSGGGDADAVVARSGALSVEIVDDAANRSTGDDSVSSGSAGSTVGQRVPRGEEELDSRSITIQNKRFYLDVKQNPRGRFIKIAEVLPDGSKSRVALSLTSAREFRNHLTQFNDFYSGSQKTAYNARKGSSSSSEGEYGRSTALKSAVIYGNVGAKFPVVGRRRYFLDLKENRRGKFLQVAEAASRAGLATRNRIVIPAQGMIEFRNHLSELLSEYWPSDDAMLGHVDEGDVSGAKAKECPQPKSLRVHQGKVLYFDSGVNPRGSFLRISQVTTRFRTSILLPKESLARVHSMLGDILHEFDAPKDAKVAGKSRQAGTKGRGSPKAGGRGSVAGATVAEE